MINASKARALFVLFMLNLNHAELIVLLSSGCSFEKLMEILMRVLE